MTRDARGRRLARAALAALALVLAVGAAQAAPRLITIGSGAFGGVYFPAAGALCRLLNRETGRHGIRCVAETSRGSLQNVADLLENATDFGIVQTDVQADAVTGRGRFAAEGPRQRLRALFALHAEPITVLARLDAGVASLSGLTGLRFSPGQHRSGTQATMAMLLGSLGMAEADFAEAPGLSPQAAASALCENHIDAFAYVVGHPNQLVRSVSESCAVSLVPIEGPEVTALLGRHPYLTPARIPGGIYVGIDRAVPTIGVRASVLTTAETDERIAYELTRAVALNLEALGGLHPALQGLSQDDLRAGLTAALHPGARRFFDEIGGR